MKEETDDTKSDKTLKKSLPSNVSNVLAPIQNRIVPYVEVDQPL